MLLLILALATMPKPLGQTLPGDLGAYASLYDETRAAATRLDLTVDALGSPIRCDVTLSDGSRTLDRVACAMLMRQARFTPARDAAGAPVAAVVRRDFTVNQEAGVRHLGPPSVLARRVDFALPVTRLPGTGGTAVADVLLMTDAAGRVTRCDVATSAGPPALDRAACRELMATTFAPARDRSGQTMPALREVSVGFIATDVPH